MLSDLFLGLIINHPTAVTKNENASKFTYFQPTKVLEN